MQVEAQEFNLASFSSQNSFQLCYPHILMGGDEIAHFYIITKSEVGVNLDVPPPPLRPPRSSSSWNVTMNSVTKQHNRLELQKFPQATHSLEIQKEEY